MVVEKGMWMLPGGKKLSARKTSFDITDYKNNWTATSRKHWQLAGSMIVLGQTMTTADDRWSHFWCSGSSSDVAPSTDDIYIGMAVGEDTDTERNDEQIGFIVLQTGASSIGGVDFISALGDETVEAITESPPYNYTFSTAFDNDPQVAIVTQAGMDGNDGSWAMLYGSDPLTTTQIKLAVDEDQITDSERGHCDEQVGYIVFEDSFAFEATFQMEVGTTTLDDEAYSTVNLQNTYTSPVVVCAGNQPGNAAPFVIRAKNCQDSKFEAKVQRPNGNAINSKTVHYMVVEQGQWELPDDRKIEAQKIPVFEVDYAWENWDGKPYTYVHEYTNPVVFGQNMTAWSGGWLYFWCCGEGQADIPDSTHCNVGLGVGEDPNTTRPTTTVGVIVVEAGDGDIDGVDYVVDVGPTTVKGMDNDPPFTYSISPTFASAPEVAVVTQAGNVGNDGSRAYIYNDGLRTNAIDLVIDEDKIYDTERGHSNESVGYFIFEDAFNYSD